MTDKAYIVTNKQQEREVLEKFEKEGYKWRSGYPPTENNYLIEEPIAVFTGDDNILTFKDRVNAENLAGSKIVYDGRKEEHMSEKYVVSQEFMNELEEWKQANFSDDFMIVNGDTIYDFSDVVNSWWYAPLSDQEQNKRLIAIIRWVNGEDVFEVEKPKKWVVRSKESDIENDYTYVYVTNSGLQEASYNKSIATKFDTKEEAQEWCNSHQEVRELIEVKE